jgi:hypothetical protein
VSIEAYGDGDLPTNDIEAERWVLAACMTAPPVIAAAAEIVSPGDFFRPVHQAIFRALVQMFAADERITPVTLKTWMERDRVKFDPVYLADLFGIPVIAYDATTHAKLVWEHSVRRKVEQLGISLAQHSRDLAESPADLIGKASRLISQMARHATPDDDGALSVRDFLALTGRATQPVIPTLLDHQERFILVGSEGAGKSTILLQMAFALAAGQHPFTGAAIPAGKALIVDLENPLEILKRRAARFYSVASGLPGWDEANVAMYARPGGLDIMNPAQAYRLAEVIRREQPDLVVCGPIYKMLPGGEVSEYHHATVTRFWDVMRDRYDIAVGLETHAPMQGGGGQERLMRPLGSGIYSRWPEFGISLTRTSKSDLILKRFRGDREEGRTWPDRLVRSTQGGWPWSAVYPPGFFQQAAIGQ